MTFETFENILSLLCTIAGLLYCVFKYIETPKRGYGYLIVFFLANFLSEYYWTIYELVMHDYPDVSGFTAYLGWNIGYLVLAVTVFSLRQKESRRYFHPIILLPLLTNIPQFILYIQYGGILNNIWEVGLTTLTMIFCLQELMYYRSRKASSSSFPWFSCFVLLYLVFSYGMWTSSCFDFPSELANPYLYCSALSSILLVLFVFGATKYYEPEVSQSTSALRFQVLIQVAASLLIIGVCAAGFFSAFGIKNSLSRENGLFQHEGQMVVYLFVISAILILMILALVFVLTSRHQRIMALGEKLSDGKRSRLNLIATTVVTLVLMVFAVIYNNVTLYKAAIVSVYEDAEEKIQTTSTDLENYLTVGVTTLRVTADSVDLMEKSGRSIDEITQYITDQTTLQAEQFDENFTGVYAYINGEYLDGLGWVPPKGYEPTERDWYKTAVEANGEIVIVSPYLDAQTGSVVITFAKSISSSPTNRPGEKNVVCLDVIVNHIKEVTQNVEIAGKGYGFVVNPDGFIIAHRDEEKNGGDLTEIYGQELLNRILNTKSGRTSAVIDGEECTLFISPVMDQWYAVIVIGNTELFEDTYSQLAVNVLVSLITFCLISFFYYIGYKNERLAGKKIEEMNLQVVSALATAIDAKDAYTNGHSSRVAEYARMIAERSGYSKREQDEIYMMGLLHDVGKIGMPDEVINKPARLSEEEYALIKTHPEIGNEILGTIKEQPKLAAAARWHHERFDGTGYPDRLAGDAIPEEARIIAVADAYDAMTSRRSYRDILPQQQVLREIKDGSGTQFDPRFAQVMIDLIKDDPDYTLRENLADK